MKIVILDGYAANPGDLDYHLLEELGEVVVYPRTSDEEKVKEPRMLTSSCSIRCR